MERRVHDLLPRLPSRPCRLLITRPLRGPFLMTQQHPITPPPELVEKWLGLWPQDALLAAAQWGADQELEACCALMELSDSNARDFLQSARRPQLLSLKEQALALIDRCNDPDNDHLDDDALVLIRRALEQLDD